MTASREIHTLELPIVLEDQLAKNISDVTLFSSWVARTGFSFDLPLKYAQLEPSDVISVTVGGVAHRMRIISTHVQSHSIVRVQAVAEDKSAFDFYSSAAQAASLQQEVSSSTATHLEFLDLPALPGESGDGPVLHMAAAGVGSGWTGSAIYRSDDNGANYSRFGAVSTAGVMGRSSDILGNASSAVFDNMNALTLLMNGDDTPLQSVTELAVLNGVNAAILGDEVIQFKTATLLAPSQYKLSGFLRGRLGTEWAISGHAAGERFVLLDGRISKQNLATNIIGLSRKYKPVSFGNSLGTAVAQDFTYTAIALKPYSPVQVQGLRDGSGNLTVSWLRRTRIGGGWQNGADIPLSEEFEKYDVEVLSGLTVVRAVSGLASPTLSYTAAQQGSDFGSTQSSVSICVYQLSATVGRGYAAQVNV